MVSHKEYEGRSVEDALNKAGLDLNSDPRQLEYEVVNEGAAGIFGLVGAQKAKIVVTLPVTPMGFTPDTAEPGKTTGKAIGSHLADGGDTTGIDAAMERGNAFLTTVAENISNGISIESTVTPHKVKLNLDGSNPAMLIGRRGETLEAMQYLTEKVTNKELDKWVRIQLDVEGYMQNRRENIRHLSLRLAEKAKRKRRPITVGKMPPHERRLVHVTLRDEPGVQTRSVGAGFIRKMMIYPENGPTHRRYKHHPRRYR